MSKAKPVATPVDTSFKLTRADNTGETVDRELYQLAVGNLPVDVDTCRYYICSEQRGQVLLQTTQAALDCWETHHSLPKYTLIPE